MDWDVYIDETGNFSRPDERVLVCGILLGREQASLHEEDAAAIFRSAYPGIPVPHHAADMGKVAGLLAAWNAANRPKAASHSSFALLAQALDELNTSDQERGAKLAAYRASFLRREMPSSKAVHAVDAILRAQCASGIRTALQVVEAEARAYAQEVRCGFQRLAPRLGIGPWVVAAGEGCTREAVPSAAVEPREAHYQDRYLWLLERLAERVLMLLRRRDGDARSVNFHVSYRMLDAGGGRTAVLTTRHVKATLQKAAGLAWPLGHVGPRPSLSELTHYEAGAPAWFGIADFAASRVLQQLKLSRYWPDVVSLVLKTTSLRPELLCSTLNRTCPAIASSGLAREAIEQACAGQHEAARGVLAGEQVRWAKAQATVWLGALKTAGRTP